MEAVLRDVPLAQLGWQLFTFNVPVACPPVPADHAVHEMDVTVTLPVAHPTVIVVGRTVGVDPGPQDNTAGCTAAIVVEVTGSFGVVSEPCAAPVVPRVEVVDAAL